MTALASSGADPEQINLVGLDPGIRIINESAPGRGVETWRMDVLKDSSGRLLKMSSVSTMFADPDWDNGFGVLRLNAAYLEGGIQKDGVQFQIYGGHGITVFEKPGERIPPGDGVIEIFGTLRLTHPITRASVDLYVDPVGQLQVIQR